MPPVAVPPSLPTPLPHDEIDNAVLDNRAALIAVAQGLNALEARVATLEAPVPPPPPPPVVTIDIPLALASKLGAVPVGSAALLRASDGTEYTMVREG